MKHISLTIEESPESMGRRVHLHAQFTFDRRIDRTCLGDLLNTCCGDTSVKGKNLSQHLALLLSCFSSVLCSCRSYDCFSFGTLKPHVGSNHARGKDVQVSRARAHFYVVCEKVGSLWSWTNWKPFSAYEVNPAWVTAWWSVQTPSFAIGNFFKGFWFWHRFSVVDLFASKEAVA